MSGLLENCLWWNAKTSFTVYPTFLVLNVFLIRAHFHANKRRLSCTGICYRCYYISHIRSHFPCVESSLTYIAQSKRDSYFYPQTVYTAERWIRDNNDPEFQATLMHSAQPEWDLRRPYHSSFVRNWIGDRRRERERRRRRCDAANGRARREVRQTNSERKGRLNVVGMWQTVGEGTLTPAHMLTAGFQVSQPSSPVHTQTPSLPEGNQVGSVREVI